MLHSSPNHHLFHHLPKFTSLHKRSYHLDCALKGSITGFLIEVSAESERCFFALSERFQKLFSQVAKASPFYQGQNHLFCFFKQLLAFILLEVRFKLIRYFLVLFFLLNYLIYGFPHFSFFKHRSDLRFCFFGLPQQYSSKLTEFPPLDHRQYHFTSSLKYRVFTFRLQPDLPLQRRFFMLLNLLKYFLCC